MRASEWMLLRGAFLPPDPSGHRFIRARFHASGWEQSQSLSAGDPYSEVVAIDGCGKLCLLDRVRALVEARLNAGR